VPTDAPVPPIWHVRALGPDGLPVWAAVVQSERHPDGTELSLTEADALAEVGDDAAGLARFASDRRVVRLEVTADAAPKAPPLWFAELREPSATPPATTLVAFTGHDVEPGTLLDRQALRKVDVTSADQLGAFRWYPASGFGDQLYVSPQWRRRTIGTGLLAAAEILAFARGWPRLHGDGQRTAEGDRMWKASRWWHRSEDLTHLMPPMTPVDERP
jgi:GNAT superfamily N-acetyltransferase